METGEIYRLSKLRLDRYKELFEVPESVTLNHFEHLFEELPCRLECSNKINGGQVFSQRLNLWFFRADAVVFNKISGFFQSLEETYNLNFSLLEKLIAGIDLDKVTQFIVGIDLREDPSNSRVKLWFIIKDYPSKVNECVAINGYDETLMEIVNNSANIFLFGFDFSLLGQKTRLKIYPMYLEEQLMDADSKQIFMHLFDEKTRNLIDKSKRFHVSFQGEDFRKVIHFTPHNGGRFLEELRHPLVNSINEKYRSFGYPPVIISLVEEQIQRGTLEDINLYY